MNAVRWAVGLVACLSASSPALACTVGKGPLMPGTWVDIASPPFDTSDPESWLYVSVEAGEARQVTVAWPNGRGGFAFVMPPSTDRPWQDVPIDRLTLSDGEEGCEMTGAVRAALPKAPGAMKRMIEAQVAGVTGIAVSLGADPAAMERATRTAPDESGWGGALHGIAEAYAALPEEGDGTMAVLDAYLAQTATHARAVVQEDGMRRLREIAPITGPDRGFIRKGDLLLRPGQAIRLAEAVTEGSPPPADRLGIGAAMAIGSAAELSEKMTLQFGASVANRPEISVFRDSAGTLLGVGALLGKLSGEKIIAPAYSALAQSLFAEAMANKLMEGLYPNSFRYHDLSPGSFALTLTPPRNRGRLDSIMVIPSAKGVDTVKLAVDAVVNFAPIFKLPGLRKIAGPSIRLASERIAARMAGTKVVTKEAFEAMGPARKELAALIETTAEGVLKQAMGTVMGTKEVPDLVKTGEFEFPPVDIFGAGYSQVEREPTGAVEWTGDDTHIAFRARKLGTARMTIVSWPGAYGNFSARTVQPVTVGALGLQVDPADLVVMPGEEVEYDAFVIGEDGTLLIVRMEPSAGFRSDGGRTTRGAHAGRLVRKTVFGVTASANPGDFPGRLTFTLPDAPGIREVRTIALPDIVPAISCLQEGETVAFSALDGKGEPVEGAVWTETTGTGAITAEGVYTAPDERGGTARIVLRGEWSDAPVDERSVRIGCTCEWSFSIAGHRFDGVSMSASSFEVGDVSTFTILTLDGKEGNFTLAGEGSVKKPITVGAGLIVGDTTYISEPRMVSTLDPKCERPTVSVDAWGSPGKGWLSGAIQGTGYIPVRGGGCVPMVPYTLDFTLRTGPSGDGGGDDEVIARIVERMRNGAMGATASLKSGSLFIDIAEQGMAGSLCLSDGKENRP